MDSSKFFSVDQIKAMRVEIDALVQKTMHQQELGYEENVVLADMTLYHTAEYQAGVKLKEAKMWLGVMLEARGTPFPPELADKAKLA